MLFIIVAFYTVPPLLSAMKAYLAFQEHVNRGEKVTKEEVGRAAIQVEKNIISRMNNKNIKILLERLGTSFLCFNCWKIKSYWI